MNELVQMIRMHKSSSQKKFNLEENPTVQYATKVSAYLKELTHTRP